MAHRLERRAVRGARDLAVGGLRALRRAALGLTLLAAAATAARAQSEAGRSDLLVSGAPDPVAWSSGPGRPGWNPERDLGAGAPWTLAGLVRGAWTLALPGRTYEGMPHPGTPGATYPLLWFDSLAVTPGEAAWHGLDGSIRTVAAGPELFRAAGTERRPWADAVFVNGASDLSDNGLTLARGDTAGALRLEAASGVRGTSGSFAGAGRDLYTAAGALLRGRHTFAGAFDHRRTNAELVGGEYERARGESGHAGYVWSDSVWRIAASVARGYDRSLSGGAAWGEITRLSDATFGALALEREGGGTHWGLRATWREAGVGPVADSTRVRTRETWVALRAARRLPGGRVEAVVGVGHHDLPWRTPVAPSLAYRFGGASWRARARLERVMTPVWADLAPGQAPFLQDVWVAGLDLDRRGTHGAGAGLSLLAGRAAQRAVITRVPLAAIALRSGYRADPDPCRFALATADLAFRARAWSVGAAGFALLRSATTVQPDVDPPHGGLAFAEASARFFRGDLRVRPRIEAAVTGPRTSEDGFALPGFVTWNAQLQLTLADATMLVEGRNLEDEPRPLVWLDSATGVEAIGAGREIRFTFSWRLWD